MRLGVICGTAFITGFSGAAMPGPMLAAGIVLASTAGFWTGPVMVVGHGVIELALVASIAAGLGRYLRRPDAPLVRGIALVGGLMLLVMGGDMLRSLPTLSLQGVKGSEAPYHPFAAGIVLSAVNPFFWLWWATIGLGLLTDSVTQRGRSGLAAFYTGHILSDFVWYSLVAGLVAGGSGLLSDPVYRGLIGLCAAALLLFGVRFIRHGVQPPPASEPAAEGAA